MAVKADFSTGSSFLCCIVQPKQGTNTMSLFVSVLMLLTVACPATAPSSADQRSVTGGREGSEG